MIAHDLITNLSVCDTQNKFQAIKSEYLDLPRKEKISNFLTQALKMSRDLHQLHVVHKPKSICAHVNF